MYTHVHTHISTYMHTHAHEHTHALVHTHAHVHTHALVHTHTHFRIADARGGWGMDEHKDVEEHREGDQLFLPRKIISKKENYDLTPTE